MKTKGLIFHPTLIPAMLDLSKTQTRRRLKTQLEEYLSHLQKMNREIDGYTWEEYKPMAKRTLWYESRMVDKARVLAKKLDRLGQFKE